MHEGETIDVVLNWYPSYRDAPPPIDVDHLMATTKAWWDDWTSGIDHQGRYHEEVVRSLIVLRALTHEDTGGIAAAATTSLPEQFGGARNWDYRYTWLRDASLTLSVLMNHGYVQEAEAWRGWLLRAIAGDPADVQIMYGLGRRAGPAGARAAELPRLRGRLPRPDRQRRRQPVPGGRDRRGDGRAAGGAGEGHRVRAGTRGRCSAR